MTLRPSVTTVVLLLVATVALVAQQPGTTYGTRFRFTATGCTAYSGTGTPEGARAGSPCDLYVRTDASGTNPALYVKLTGVATTTGWVALLSGSGAAPTNATYLTQTADDTLSAEQALATLATGLMQVTTTTGVVTSVTTSSGLAALLSDETGTGAAVFGTTPTFTTSLTVPKIITASNGTLELDPDGTGTIKLVGQFYSPTVTHAAAGATETVNWNDGNTHRVILDENLTLTLTNPVDGGQYTLLLAQDGAGGNTVSWPDDVLWTGGTAPTITATADTISVCQLSYDTTSTVYLGRCDLNYVLTEPPAAESTRWRLNVSAVDGGSYVGVAEMQMRESEGGADACTGGTATASTEFSASYSADKAFDDQASTYWASASNVPQWLEYEFAASVGIVEYVITARPSSYNQSPKDFTLEYWDGDSWEVADTRTNETGWTANQSRTYQVSWAAPRPSPLAALTPSRAQPRAERILTGPPDTRPQPPAVHEPSLRHMAKPSR